MPFIRMPGIVGKIYVPEEKPGNIKKHNCKDCHSCQMCSDDRCRLCRGEESCVIKKPLLCSLVKKESE
ncbi:Uncharacterized protein dnm_007750 [Desulfonema magnum]|uniref:Uncharacterized protein n=1 Tax=Desulfonema magnum TaxID=45655 RepID=A0A975BGT0_9BACT|nr:Uncharacterized protein dnm_007750 [Desulfonema magnum]